MRTLNRNQPCPGGCGKKVKNCACPKGPLIYMKRFAFHVGIVLMFVVIVVAVLLRNNTPEPVVSVDVRNMERSSRSSLRQQLLDWPLPPAPSIKVKIERPAVPIELPSVQFINGRPALNDIEARIRFIVEHHPIEEVRSLSPLFKSGELILDFQKPHGALAYFHVLQPSDLKWIRDPSKLQKFNPALGVDITWLAQLKGQHGILEGALVIFHEFLHYKQWKTEVPERKSWWLPVIPEKRTRLSLEYCEYKFQKEVDAHATSCSFQNRWGLTSPGQRCAYLGTPHFQHAVFLGEARRSDEFWESCGPHMARAAGHPAFR